MKIQPKFILIIVVIIVALAGGFIGYKKWLEIEKEKTPPPQIPTISETPPDIYFQGEASEKDPPTGNSGEIKMKAKKIEGGIQLSWPDDHLLINGKLWDLGSKETSYDNYFLANLAPQSIDDERTLSPTNIGFSEEPDWFKTPPRPFEEGRSYLVETSFLKKDGKEISQGILRFQY